MMILERLNEDKVHLISLLGSDASDLEGRPNATNRQPFQLLLVLGCFC